MRRDYSKLLQPIRFCEPNCDLCKESLESSDVVLECPDCGAIFCKECVEDRFFDTHQCEDYADDEEYDPITWREDDVALFTEGYWCD